MFAYTAAMANGVWKKAGLTAVIMLAPGGFVLGATLLLRHYRAKAAPPPLDKD